MKQAVVLAGGKGTRLRDLLGDKPKPLLEIDGMPLLQRQLLLLQKHGFEQAVLLVNHKADKIRSFCDQLDGLTLDIRLVDDGTAKGTAGAVASALDYLEQEFLVVYGDTMLDVDLTRFHDWHRRATTSEATIFVHPNNHPYDSDLVEVDDANQVIAFHPYPHEHSRYLNNLVNAALYWIRKETVAAFAASQHDLQQEFDFGKHLFPWMLENKRVIHAYKSPEYIKDAGTPDRVDQVIADLRSGKIERSSLSVPQPIVCLDRDGTLIQSVDHLNQPDDLELLPGATTALKRLNATGMRCAVVTNQPVIARGECSVETLGVIHAKLETLLGADRAFLDSIYYCPHHPDSGFAGEVRQLKIACDCRKPQPGMLNRALEDLRGIPSDSWMIGDTTVDIEAARRAGMMSVLVETGSAGKDGKFEVIPDFTFPDVERATDFIVNEYPALFTYCLQLAKGINSGDTVLLGGYARSGKSTFAAVLKRALDASGKSAHRIQLDRWLKSTHDRSDGVLGRYDLSAAAKDLGLNVSQRPNEIVLSYYDKQTRTRIPETEVLQLTTDDILIVEGTLALELSMHPSIRTHRFFLSIDEQLRCERFYREYRVRGYEEEAIRDLYESRCIEECPTIARGASDAKEIHLDKIS